MFSIEKQSVDLSELHQQYISASPFPHILLDNFLPQEMAEKLLEDFPGVTYEGWIHYRHYNENKHGLNSLDKIPGGIRDFIQYMNSNSFVQFLENLTGIKKLLPDNTLEGAGIHLSERGGHLNIHADFAFHPKIKKLHRRLNVLLYLNKNWKKEYNGDLEFWTADMKRCEKKIAPEFNRLVIFNTTALSYHGSPEPLLCPQEETRKSIALYYYTPTEADTHIASTNYRTRPGDGLKVLPNWIDNRLLFAYTYLKRKGRVSDRFASRLLGIREWFRRKNGQ